MCYRLTRVSRGKCSIRYSAGTRQFVTGTRLDDYLGGDFFYLRLRRVLTVFLVKREYSSCLARYVGRFYKLRVFSALSRPSNRL
ncbi:hypothetical protein DPMN_041741 [Dreissena polymorpha]|uniref:Uncharacterized protein n=1 Tax=Dreissena polymorpha TaxID=45954 RepID=A0A9D4CZW1_DREPO|nr:hypothetical protein DPMN_041741 [Dreissena polymorpha]